MLNLEIKEHKSYLGLSGIQSTWLSFCIMGIFASYERQSNPPSVWHQKNKKLPTLLRSYLLFCIIAVLFGKIQTGVVEGKFPRRALNAVLEWYVLHKNELLEDWKLAEQKTPLNRIEPLE